ncbi:MAG: M14 family zinc carboxypeptidase [Ignavibacteria bacterium]|nr:M14 family zinc carboxypeptidase [Ignavibacteria bacterium]
MIIRVLFLSAALLFGFSGSYSTEKFSRIRIAVTDQNALKEIWSTGLDFEGSTGKPGGLMTFVAGEFELAQLAAKGVAFEVMVDDLAAHTEERILREQGTTDGFGFGSMGGFYTFAEVLAQLDSMYLQYPNLITPRDSIGTTHQSRGIWAAKISDNPGLSEPEEPEVLYTALHHAREPQSMMTVVYYMWWLLENYGTDADATYLVNNRQIWFIPVVNPDGYEYNRQTNPNGGGFWRKNRRFNGGGIYGVDPNRNYGPEFMWNAPNGGSSTSPSSDTYRGPAPFSEPENSAIDQFMRGHNIRACFNYHTSGNLLIYPWGYLSQENGDSLIYRDWGYDLTASNHYVMGTDLQTVNYSTRGNSDDYMFGDLTKPVTFAMTPEVGTTGFWPGQNEIFPLAQENLSSNKLLSYFAGAFPEVRSAGIVDKGEDGFVNPGEVFELMLLVLNKGLGVSDDLTITATSSTPFVQFTPSVQSLGDLLSQEDVEVSFTGEVGGTSPSGVPFQVFINFSNPDGFSKTDTVDLYIGTPTVVFADSASGGTGNWTTGQGWGLTGNAHSAPNAFTDSPSGSYRANANNSLTLINQVSLAGFDYAELRFWTKWAIEPTWDFATVEVSTNNGSSWTTLRTSSATRGSGRSSEQPTTSWGYDSYVPGLDWKEETADLSAYAGLQIKIRFRLASDGGVERDGFYVDDIRIHGYEEVASSGGIQCSDIFFFNAKCNPSGAAQAMVKMTGDWSGETVTFDLDGEDMVSTVLSNGINSIAKMTVPHAGAGPHTITLEIPTGCYSPVDITCAVDAAPDPEWEALWNEYDVLEQQSAQLPAQTGLVGNYPNPFNPSTTFRYALSEPNQVSLKVYNMLGQLVKTVVQEQQVEGYYEVLWDGRNETGAAVSSGIYIYRLTAGSVTETRRMLMLK